MSGTKNDSSAARLKIGNLVNKLLRTAPTSRTTTTPDTKRDSATVQLKISKLERSEHSYRSRDRDSGYQQSEPFSVSLPGDTPLSTLWSKIEDAGFKTPEKLSDLDGRYWDVESTQVVLEPFDEVKVVKGISTGPDAIGLDERLMTFAHRHFGVPLLLNIDEDATSRGNPSDCLKESLGLKINFLRTARMPDDDKLHPLPSALGSFPLYSVSAYENVLPDKMVREGGVFLPMWQREALWIGFECKTSVRYALRISVGRINAVSGQEMKHRHSKKDGSPPIQDYVVVPGQPWLDGICVGPGVVRQFVAMPLGSGYTVEGQKTGEEKHGGLQIEIIPAFQEDLRLWLRDDSIPDNLDPDAFLKSLGDYQRIPLLDEQSTPRQLGLDPRTKLRCYPSPAFKKRPSSLSDIARHKDEPVQLLAFYPSPPSSFGWDARGPFSPALYSYSSYRTAPYVRESYGGPPVMPAPVIPASYGPAPLGPPSHGLRRAEAEDHRRTMLANTIESDKTKQRIHIYDDDNPEAAVRAATKILKSMGLAAGGKLIQDIIEDPNPADLWNTAVSKLVYIHILDPASCEAVTHIVPAPPPIDAETYAKSNMPFFVLEEKPDERLEGGDFDNVKSVSAMDKEKGWAEEQSLDPKRPVRCQCGVRLCDCVVRPCNHTFCHICIKQLVPKGAVSWSSAEPAQKADWKCPICQVRVAHVAGFSTPMNLPGEESIKMRVAVNVLEVRDGRPEFKSVHKARI